MTFCLCLCEELTNGSACVCVNSIFHSSSVSEKNDYTRGERKQICEYVTQKCDRLNDLRCIRGGGAT